MRDGKPSRALAGNQLHRRQSGKPVGINEHIGRRPIAAFGNSDGDLEMLQWTTSAMGARLGSDRPPHRRRARVGLRSQASIGRLDKAYDAATLNGWTVVDMKKDWKIIFPFEKK